MTTQKTLSDLQPGDKVIFHVNRRREIKTVKRLTNTRIILGWENYVGQPYERSFEKRNGYEWGSSNSYNYARIAVYTEEEEKDMIIEGKRKKVEELSIRFPDHYNYTLIDEVYNFLTEKGFLK